MVGPIALNQGLADFLRKSIHIVFLHKVNLKYNSGAPSGQTRIVHQH